MILLKKPNRRALPVAVLFAALVLAFASGTAYGSSGDHDKSIGAIKVVEPCTAAQAHANHDRGALGEHGDAFYRCRETKPGCFQWVWQYDGRPKSGHTYPPRPCPKCSPSPSVSPSVSKSPSTSASPSTSPSPSKSASTSPSASKSPSSSPSPSAPVHGSAPAAVSPQPSGSTTPVAVTLPITGIPGVVVGIAVFGLAMVGIGAVLLLTPLRRRRRT